MKTIKFGRYRQGIKEGVTPIEWFVLKETGDKALLLSRYALDAKSFNNILEKTCWKYSSVRRWLNVDFVNTAFTEEERSAIMDTRSKQSVRGVFNNGDVVQDKVFLLDYIETSYYLTPKINRRCEPTEYAATLAGDGCGWWLRSFGLPLNTAMYVDAYGEFASTSVIAEKFIRPALWIKLESVISEHKSEKIEEPELKPCPFCGGEAKLGMYSTYALFIQCAECGATSKTYEVKHKKPFEMLKSIEEQKRNAINNWNKRKA